MDYIGDRKAWQAFLVENEGDISPHLIKEPTMYPCYAYTTVDSVEFGWIAPAYLYQSDLKRMLKNMQNK